MSEPQEQLRDSTSRRPAPATGEAYPGSVGSGAVRATADQPTVVSKHPPMIPPVIASESAYRILHGTIEPGDRLGHFELIEFIGGGGMGRVFRAYDTRLARYVAVKILPPEQATDEETRLRFQNEAQSAARLDHDNIARVFYVGEDHGLLYIVFEYIEGENLRDLVERVGPLSLTDAISFTLQIADALSHAAERSVVHRDIKPSNILITRDGHAKLIDMGLARLRQVDAGDDLTASGVTLGTFDYISPEQARDPRHADVRSDIYSLGCTLFFMLTGRPPFPEGTVLQKLLQHQGDQPPDVREFRSDIPDDLVRIMRKMLAKDPRSRYQSPRPLVDDLLRLAEQSGLQLHGPKRPWVPQSSSSWNRLQEHLAWVVPTALLLMMVAAAPWLGPWFVPKVDGTAVDAATTSEFSPWRLPPPEEAPSAIGSPRDGVGVSDSGGSPSEAIPEGPRIGKLGTDVPSRSPEDGQTVESVGVEPRVRPGEVVANPPTEPSTARTSPRQGSDANGVSGETQASAARSGVFAAETPSEPKSTGMPESMAWPTTTWLPGMSGNGGLINGSMPEGALWAGMPSRMSAEPIAELRTSAGRLDATASASGAIRRGRVLIVDGSGGREGRFATIEEACAACEDGDVVEVACTQAVWDTSKTFSAGRLTIRGAAGFFPVIVVQASAEHSPGSALIAPSVRLSILDVHLRVPAPTLNSGRALFEVAAHRTVRLDRCAITVDGTDVGSPPAGRCAIFVLRAKGASEPDEASRGSGMPRIELTHIVYRGSAVMFRIEEADWGRVLWNNGVFAGNEAMIVVEEHTERRDPISEGVSIELRHLSALAPGGLLRWVRPPEHRSAATVELQLTDSVVAGSNSRPMVECLGFPSVEEVLQALRYQGDGNLFDGFDRYLSIHESSAREVAALGFEEWADLWGRRCENSTAAPIPWRSRPDVDRPLRLMVPSELILDMPHDDMGTSDGRPVGADIESLPSFTTTDPTTSATK